MSNIPHAFIYNDRKYISVVPVKALFSSNLIHNVVTRGDVFAVDLDTQLLTIIPGRAKITPITCTIITKSPAPPIESELF